MFVLGLRHGPESFHDGGRDGAHPARARMFRGPGQHEAAHPAILHANSAEHEIDPVWFGVLFLIAMQLGLLSPFGLLVFTMKSVAPPEITVAQVFRAVTPYVLIGRGTLIAILFIPGVAIWLPSIAG
jgi:TRAP-type C4-dicarboxylate transport system permease large subunit